MVNPKISVVVPVYNQEKYLAETIESILAQTFTEFELILVDDGSSDKSADIIRQYAERDSRIVPIIQPNAGKPKAVNTAASIAQGEYLAFMDHDDLMLPNRLERQLAFLAENPEVDAISCHCYYIGDNGELMGTQFFPQLKTIAEARNVVANNEVVVVAFTGLMANRKLFISSGGLDSTFWPADDIDFFNRFIETGHVLVVMQEILMKYRAHSSSTSITNAWEVLVERSDYASHCVRARRKGEAQISFAEFKAISNNKPWLEKQKRKALFYGLLFHKEAGFAMHTRKYGEFAWKILVASFLNPEFMVATIRKRLSMNAK